jgi:hypothetical protein
MEPQTFIDAVLKLDIGAFKAGRNPPELLIEREGPLGVYYAPFEHVPQGAQLVIVGLTPGRGRLKVCDTDSGRTDEA